MAWIKKIQENLQQTIIIINVDQQLIWCSLYVVILYYREFSIHFILYRELLTQELESVGIRLNREKPNIYYKVCGLYWVITILFSIHFFTTAKTLG